jgi:class 3 adenylate cyclase
MDEQKTNVIEFPTHRRGSLADTFAGFAPREDGPSWRGTRRERLVSLVVADLRGHGDVAARLGAPVADAAVHEALTVAVGVLRSSGGQKIAVGGEDSQPVITAEFSEDDHAAGALIAAVSLRDAVHASTPGIEACTGVNSGAVIDTALFGDIPVVYRAMATVRMFAVRLQEFAGPGQILVSATTMALVRPGIARIRSIGPVRTNAGGETTEAFSILHLSAAAPADAPARGASGA